jgi:hypothetical protein
MVNEMFGISFNELSIILIFIYCLYKLRFTFILDKLKLYRDNLSSELKRVSYELFETKDELWKVKNDNKLLEQEHYERTIKDLELQVEEISLSKDNEKKPEPEEPAEPEMFEFIPQQPFKFKMDGEIYDGIVNSYTLRREEYYGISGKLYIQFYPNERGYMGMTR